MKKELFLLFFIFIANADASCVGRIFNPITDVCWECILPINISVGTTSGSIPENYEYMPAICYCPKLPIPPYVLPGIPIGWWEGFEIIEVVKEPFCLVNLGGITTGQEVAGMHTGGSPNNYAKSGKSTWHVHQFTMPIFKIIGLVFDALCMEISSPNPFELGYISELDVMWYEDELMNILSPESVIFANIIAQAACAADCLAATIYPTEVNNALFWCAGCQGSMYPLTGNTSDTKNELSTATLMLEKFAYKMHRELVYMQTSGIATLCQPLPNPVIKKTQYRTQLTYPIPMNVGGLLNGCQPFGRSHFLYESYKEIPIVGENFGFLLWRKRHCCAF
ncbi:MAG: TraU family protein [Rickettsiales bacterium]|jgi:conjugal transfer pilus assembly protein TraU|nr:TraU family protein [Rickettsiales bacterium]